MPELTLILYNKKHESHKKVCENFDDTKILEFSQYSKSDKDPLIIDIIESYSGRHFPVMKKGNQFVTD